MLPEEGNLYISMEEPPTSSGFNSRVLVLNLFDFYGDQRSSFSDEAEICFTVTADESRDNQCLGYYDEEKEKWICEDPCLKDDDGLLW